VGPGEAVLLLGKLAFAVAGLATGAQLVRMARSEEGLGVHALAAAALFVGAASQVLMPVGHALGPGAGAPVAVAGEVLLRVAVAGLWIFLWRVFRPGSPAMGALALAGVAGLVATGAWDVLAQPDITRYDASLPAAHVSQLALALPFAWSAVETGVAHARARRRLAVGLADPLVCDRFRLWCLATALLTGICALGAAAGMADGAGRAELTAALSAVRGLVYLPLAACVWLGMFPPAWYRRRLAAAAS